MNRREHWSICNQGPNVNALEMKYTAALFNAEMYPGIGLSQCGAAAGLANGSGARGPSAGRGRRTGNGRC